jgi:hypothetical protein
LPWIKGKVHSDTAIQLQGHPGREIKGTREGAAFHLRVCVVNERTFVLTVVGDKGQIAASKTAAFLASFELKK